MMYNRPLKPGDLKRFCDACGFSMAEFARRMGVAYRTVVGWNTCEKPMSRAYELAAFTVSAGFTDFSIVTGSAQQYLAIKDYAAITRLKHKPRAKR